LTGERSSLDRLTIAKKKVKDLVSKHQDYIELALLYGSAGRGKEMEFSDIDIALIVKRKVPSELTVDHDVIVECFFVTRKDALRGLADPSAERWFFWAGLLSTARILYGDKRILGEFKQTLGSVTRQQYDEAARKKLLWMFEGLGHIRNSYSSGDLVAAMGYAAYYRNAVGEFVALINGQHYSSHVFRSIDEAKTFELIPRGYPEMTTELSTSNDIARIHELAVNLFEACSAIASQKGIQLRQK
jgi:predicted nucleotidyltransferase